MSDHDSPAEDAMPDRSEEARLARLDDVLAGQAAAFARSPDETEPPSTSPPDDTEAVLDEDALNTPTDLEMLLLLRQVAATERGLPETEEDTDTPPVVPPFEVVRIIGRGGFSSVFLAVDPRMSRTLAVKLIRPEAMLMPGMRRRFLREAEIAARLNHPCIVTVHDVGAADGRVYIAQEYCEGGSLAQWLATHEGPVPPREAAAFLLDVAEAVHAAHAAGVLHRDLKPANLLLVARQSATHEPPAGNDTDADRLSAWRAKVGDFGLATLRTDDSGAQLTRLTMTGCRLGTPAWMAPEQVDQSYGKVSEATDVYAMGLILERLLTGHVSQAASSDAESFRRILLEEPTPPDHLVPGLSADLAAVCVTCLQKKPKDRYASAAHLADDLRRFLDASRPTPARSRRLPAFGERPPPARWPACWPSHWP